jgi:hypothetical protein
LWRPQRRGVAGFEYGVEVAEQQQALALAVTRCAGARGQQVAGALHFGRHVDPAGLEAERVELGAEQLPDGAHALQVIGAAIDQRTLPEQLERLRAVGADRGHDALFDRAECRAACRAER